MDAGLLFTRNMDEVYAGEYDGLTEEDWCGQPPVLQQRVASTNCGKRSKAKVIEVDDASCIWDCRDLQTQMTQDIKQKAPNVIEDRGLTAGRREPAMQLMAADSPKHVLVTASTKESETSLDSDILEVSLTTTLVCRRACQGWQGPNLVMGLWRSLVS